MSKKIIKLKLELTAAVLVLITILVSGFFIFGIDMGKVAKALTYSKSAGEQLTNIDWNNLVSDFLARDGTGSMNGSLNMNNNRITNLAVPVADNEAVSRGVMNTAISSAISSNSSIKDTSGNILKMVCGTMPVTNSNTANPYNWTLRITVNTNATGFSNTYYYFSGLGGLGNHYRNTGIDTIYSPTNTSFILYLQYYDPFNPTYLITVNDAITWGWYVNWCALGS